MELYIYYTNATMELLFENQCIGREGKKKKELTFENQCIGREKLFHGVSVWYVAAGRGGVVVIWKLNAPRLHFWALYVTHPFIGHHGLV